MKKITKVFTVLSFFASVATQAAPFVHTWNGHHVPVPVGMHFGHPEFGVHPHGPGFGFRPWDRPHPYMPFPAWVAGNMARSAYSFEWNRLHQVTCTAQAPSGMQFTARSSNWSMGWGVDKVSETENIALNQCYYASGHNPHCFIVGCTPYYHY